MTPMGFLEDSESAFEERFGRLFSEKTISASELYTNTRDSLGFGFEELVNPID
jgi:hypothetical protein